MLYCILPQRPASLLGRFNVTMRILERRKARLLKGSKMFQLKNKCIMNNRRVMRYVWASILWAYGLENRADSHNRTFSHLFAVPLTNNFSLFGNDRINVVEWNLCVRLPYLHSCRRSCRMGTANLRRINPTFRIYIYIYICTLVN